MSAGIRWSAADPCRAFRSRAADRSSLGPRRAATAALLVILLTGGAPGLAATLTGRLMIAGAPSSDAVVALRSLAPVRPPSSGAAAPHAVMDQRHLSFQPGVLPVLRGTIVEFTNSDDVEHNVFSPSAIADAFDLGTYSHGQSRNVKLDQVGEVHVLCNIHMEMEAHILVLDEPYFAVTDAKGVYAIRDVPAGEYELSVWSNGWLPKTEAVTLPATGETHLDVAAPH